MSKKVFVSYCHRQGDWVWDRLVPCLRAGGAEVLIDRDHFAAGQSVTGQMDALQNTAEINVLVFTPDYLLSDYCRHEMARAIACDPQFNGSIIPVKRDECAMPDEIKLAELVWVNLVNDKDAAQWDLLLEACGANLEAEAPHWLAQRDEALQFLQRGQSINLVAEEGTRWRELIEDLRSAHLPELRTVDLQRGAAVSRRGLVEELLKACGVNRQVPAPPEDLVVLDRTLSVCPITSYVALLHGELLNRADYGEDLIHTLKCLIMDDRKLVLLVQSRHYIAQILKHNHCLSVIDWKTVVLTGRRR
jgi:hypothetical protein